MKFWEEKPIVGAQLASHVALALEEAGIAYVLWGFQAISFAGEILGHRLSQPTEVEFVVPDALIPRAVAIFVHIGFTLCEDQIVSNCTQTASNTPRRWAGYSPKTDTTQLQRSTSTSVPTSSLSSANRRSYGDWNSSPTHLLPTTHACHRACKNAAPAAPGSNPPPRHQAIKILKLDTLTEAFLILLARDWHHSDYRRDQWIDYKDSLLETPEWPADDPRYKRTLTRPGFQLAWDYLNGRRPKSYNAYLALLRLRERLIGTKVDITIYVGGKEFLKSVDGA
ncbi:uncharacterized protein BDV14DRAFT_202676 [Aspergillus stella-maris]|uniref:uncharacterized protein n=1 Tax=Aspergillus stella-maris TaxID=1810926 RepID=UPI003CCDBF6B